MAKKRKSRPSEPAAQQPEKHEYSLNETFDDSEDEFYAHRDKILLDEGPVTKRRRKYEEQHADLEPSDEEVFGGGDISDEDDEAASDLSDEQPDGAEEESDEQQDLEEEEEHERMWGTSRKDYYNADRIETEADALEEEAEARRLQRKQLKGMTEADFGFDETEWAAADKPAESGRPIVEKLPPVQIPENATIDERLTILRSRYPEFEPLADDLVDLTPELENLKVQAETEISRPSRGDADRLPSSLIRFRALSAYLAAIAMYMAILTSTKDGLAFPPSELREHPIMDSLLRCRQLWEMAKGLEDLYGSVYEDDNEEGLTKPTTKAKVTPAAKSKTEVGELRASTQPVKGQLKPESRKVEQRSEIRAPSPEPYQTLSSKRSKKEKKQKRYDFQDLLAQAARAEPNLEDSDFGDEAPLTHEEAAEKAKKKKSLRFYTSQIAQKANKRGAASREAGGDDDLPYKERIRDKQERLMREAEHRASKAPQPDDPDDDLDDEGLVEEINGDANNYYDQVVSKSKQKKADKQARADAYAEAARQGAQVFEEEQVGPDGKRRITYAIAKNKGLIPKRKKEVRNPRVKKKQQYDKKMKKLGSMRPVYKGGEGKGGYRGELTGIKTNVVKSVKL